MEMEETRGGKDLTDTKGREKSDWDVKERKLRERSRRAESGLNLIKAWGTAAAGTGWN